jgi:hypothetical protein
MGDNGSRGKGKQAQWLRDHADYTDPKCLIWPFFRNPNGYGQLGHLGKQHYAHRLMCEFAHGTPPTPAHEAAHRCGSGHQGCVNPKHLTWKTKEENRRDSTSHGRGGRNLYGNKGRFNRDELREILTLKGKMKQREIAARYGVDWTTISSIYCGQTYAKVVESILTEPEFAGDK